MSRFFLRLNAFGEALADEAFGALFMRPDGTSVHELDTVASGAKESSYTVIRVRYLKCDPLPLPHSREQAFHAE